MKAYLYEMAPVFYRGKLLTTFFTISAMAFVAKMAIVAKELSVASRFGRKDELDAFLIAFLIPSFIVSILGTAMSSAFVPVYIRVREKNGSIAAHRLFASLSMGVLLLLFILALLVYFLIPAYLPLVAAGFEPAKLQLTNHLIKPLIPFVVLSGVSCFWSAMLTAEERFSAVILTPMVSPLLTIGLLVFDPGVGIYALAYAVVLGAGLELVIFGVILVSRGFSLLPRRSGVSWKSWTGWKSRKDSYEFQALVQFLPAIAGGVLMGSSVLVDQSMAAILSSGSVAALHYGNKIIGFVLSVFSTTIVTMLTPYFSKELATRSGYDLYKAMRKPLLTVFALSFLIPLTVCFFNEPLVKLIFYRGAFNENDTKMVAGVQTWLVWHIPFYITATILVRFIVSMRFNWVLPVVSAFNVAVNIFLNYLLMERMGVAGIALSTTLVHLFSFALLLLFCLYISRKSTPSE